MATVDLDAARAARSEARSDNPTVTLGGREYKLVPELYVDAAQAFRNDDAEGFVRLILADPSEADDFLANRLSWSDLAAVLGAWRVTQGESSAS